MGRLGYKGDQARRKVLREGRKERNWGGGCMVRSKRWSGGKAIRWEGGEIVKGSEGKGMEEGR